MPYDYHDTPVVTEEDAQMLTLTDSTVPGIGSDTHILTLEDSTVPGADGRRHTLTLEDPRVPGVSSSVHGIRLRTPIVSTQGTNDYEELINKPIINGVELIGSLSLKDLGINLDELFKFKGSVDTYLELTEIEDPNKGDIYYVVETGKTYVWDGTTWNIFDNLIDLSNYWSKDELIPITSAEIDEITGIASTASSFLNILSKSDRVAIDEDISLLEQVTINKAVTIDLNSQTISSSISSPLFVVSGGTLTIKGSGSIETHNKIASVINGGKLIINGGSLDSEDIGIVVSGSNSRVTFNKGSLNATEGGIEASYGAEIVVNGGHISAENNYALFTPSTSGRGNNSIIVDGGTIVGNNSRTNFEACGVYIANNDTFLMNNGSITGNNGCGLLMRAGNITINGGSVTATGTAGTTGLVGNSLAQMSKSAIIYHERANLPSKIGMRLAITGGSFTGVDHSIEVLSNETTPNVVVTGGVFNPAYPE